MDSHLPNFQQLTKLIKEKTSENFLKDIEKKYNQESRKDDEYDFNDSGSDCDTFEFTSKKSDIKAKWKCTFENTIKKCDELESEFENE